MSNKRTLIDYLHKEAMNNKNNNKSIGGKKKMKNNLFLQVLSIVIMVVVFSTMVQSIVLADETKVQGSIERTVEAINMNKSLINKIVKNGSDIIINGVSKTINEYNGKGNANLQEYKWFDTKMIGMDYNPDYRNIDLEIEMNGFAIHNNTNTNKSYLYLRDTKDVFAEVYEADGVTTEQRELMYIVFDKVEGEIIPIYAPKDFSDTFIKYVWMYSDLSEQEIQEQYNLEDEYVKYELSTVIRFNK